MKKIYTYLGAILVCLSLNAQSTLPISFTTEEGESIEDVEVCINSDCAPSSSTVTVEIGDTITPVKNTNPLNGVSAFDFVLILRHILGTHPLDSDLKVRAADVSESGTVTLLDLILIRFLILQVITDFPSGKSWVFEPDFRIVNNPTDSLHFTGIKLGDVNGSASPLLDDAPKTHIRNANGNLNFHTKNKYLKKGEAYRLPIFSKNFKNILGGQMTFSFDAENIDFQSVTSNSDLLKEENLGLQFVEEGKILMLWAAGTGQNIASDEAFFEINFIAKKEGWISDLFQINSSKIAAEAYLENGSAIGFLNIQWSVENEVSNALQVSPNPFSDFTKISFTNETTGNVILNIYDLTGKKIFSIENEMSAGRQEFSVDRSTFPTSGVFIFEIRNTQKSESGKLMVR